MALLYHKAKHDVHNNDILGHLLEHTFKNSYITKVNWQFFISQYKKQQQIWQDLQ